MTAARTPLMGASREEVRARLGPMEPVACPICRQDDAQPFAVDFYGFHIVRCRKCRLLYLNPRPTYDWLIENVYVEEYHQTLASVRQPMDDNLRYLFTRQLAGIERHTRRGRLLDVGCGQGGFLAFAAERGWQIYGTEVSAALVAALQKDLPQGAFFCGPIHEVDFGGLRFEAIRLNHVLEHTQDPARELGRARELLAPGGVIYLSVPNVASLDARIKNLLSRLRLKGKPYRHFTALHHLWFFTPATMKRLAVSVGLRVAALETPVYFSGRRSPGVARAYGAALQPLGLGNCVDAYLTKRD